MFMYTCIWRGCIGWWEQCNLCKIKIINSASFWFLFNIPWMWLRHHYPGWETYEKHYFKQTTVKVLGCVCEVSEVRPQESWRMAEEALQAKILCEVKGPGAHSYLESNVKFWYFKNLDHDYFLFILYLCSPLWPFVTFHFLFTCFLALHSNIHTNILLF